MTSPEWLAADEDDSDRFPQTSDVSTTFTFKHSCGATVHVVDAKEQPHECSNVPVPDPARVARYAEPQCVMVGHRLATTAYDAARFRISELETPMGWRLGDVIARLVLDSGAVAVADEERAALVSEVERLRAQMKAAERWAMSERRLTDEALKLRNAAEANVAKVEALADEWERGAPGLEWNVPIGETFAASLRAVLADAPAERCTCSPVGGPQFDCPQHGADAQWAKGGA